MPTGGSLDILVLFLSPTSFKFLHLNFSTSSPNVLATSSSTIRRPSNIPRAHKVFSGRLNARKDFSPITFLKRVLIAYWVICRLSSDIAQNMYLTKQQRLIRDPDAFPTAQLFILGELTSYVAMKSFKF